MGMQQPTLGKRVNPKMETAGGDFLIAGKCRFHRNTACLYLTINNGTFIATFTFRTTAAAGQTFRTWWFFSTERNETMRKELELKVKDKKNRLNQRTYLACSKLHNSNRKVRSFPSIQGNPRQCKAHSWRSTRHSIGQSYPHQQRRHLHTSWLKANGSWRIMCNLRCFCELIDVFVKFKKYNYPIIPS